MVDPSRPLRPQFEVVGEIPETTQSENNVAERVSAHALMIALKALSQRALVALADLFMLTTVGSAFWLWWSTPKPDTYQIVSLSIYAVFILAANYIVRSRRA